MNSVHTLPYFDLIINLLLSSHLTLDLPIEVFPYLIKQAHRQINQLDMKDTVCILFSCPSLPF